MTTARIICPLTKSPAPIRGRVGKVEHQDWYRSLARAAEMVRQEPLTRILVLSAFRVQESDAEADIYYSTLAQFSVSPERIVLVREETETIGQVEYAVELAHREGSELTFIASLFHAPRVYWLTRNVPATLKIGFGIPRPRDVVTDLTLAVLFPLIDLFGFRKQFQDYVRRRRAKGKL